MARRRGWGGDPPASDAEARARIVTAAVQLLASTGRAISLADVAESLGVIRQTVYRYFSTADALMQAAAVASAEEFLDQLADHLLGIHDPAEAMTEAVLYTLDEVSARPHLGILLTMEPSVAHRDVASGQARELGMRMITRFDVDWAAYGYDDAALAELVEFTLRIMLSYFVAPLATPDDPRGQREELRRFLRRWLGETILAQHRADSRDEPRSIAPSAGSPRSRA